jgi:hypothetical protein
MRCAAGLQSGLCRVQVKLSKAEHQFARYSQNLRILVLHFEDFRCGDARAICTHAGCLHQIYTSTGGRCQLLRNYYAPKGD